MLDKSLLNDGHSLSQASYGKYLRYLVIVVPLVLSRLYLLCSEIDEKVQAKGYSSR